MLYSVGSRRKVRTIPHRRFYETYRRRISDAQYQAIYDELNERIDSNEVHASSWIPGANWMATVYQPIYDTACRCNQELAAQLFGLILWQVMMDRPEAWSFGRYEKDNVPIEGITYFRVEMPS